MFTLSIKVVDLNDPKNNEDRVEDYFSKEEALASLNRRRSKYRFNGYRFQQDTTDLFIADRYGEHIVLLIQEKVKPQVATYRILLNGGERYLITTDAPWSVVSYALHQHKSNIAQAIASLGFNAEQKATN